MYLVVWRMFGIWSPQGDHLILRLSCSEPGHQFSHSFVMLYSFFSNQDIFFVLFHCLSFLVFLLLLLQVNIFVVLHFCFPFLMFWHCFYSQQDICFLMFFFYFHDVIALLLQLEGYLLYFFFFFRDDVVSSTTSWYLLHFFFLSWSCHYLLCT